MLDPGGVGVDAIDAREFSVFFGRVEVDAGADGFHVRGAFGTLAVFEGTAHGGDGNGS